VSFLAIIGGGSIYITQCTRATTVAPYKLQRIWTRYELSIFAGLGIDLVGKVYRIVGPSVQKKIEK